MKSTGWVIFAAGLAMMLTLLAGDFNSLKSWHDATYPAFAGGVMLHIAAVITAAIGGNLVPNMFRDRSQDLSKATMDNLKSMEMH